MKLLFVILCLYVYSATTAGCPHMTEGPINPWYSTRIKKIFDATASNMSGVAIVTPTSVLYKPGTYTSGTCVLTINEAVALCITQCRYTSLVENGVNVVEAKGDHVGVLVYARRYALFGKKVWRVRKWTKAKLHRKSEHVYVQTINFTKTPA